MDNHEQIAAWRERIQVKERTLSRTGDEYLKSVLRADINWLRQKVRDAEVQKDFSRELEERMPRGLTRDEFFERAEGMTHYLDHTAQYSQDEIDRAWWWYDLTK